MLFFPCVVNVFILLTTLACHTCRRRRVKCDERRPTCERCEKGNHECEGYQRNRVWIDEGARTVRLARREKPWEYLEDDGQSKDLNQDIPATLGLEAFRQNIYVSYLLAKLFRGGIMCIDWNWLRSHAEDSGSAAAQDSLRALSTAYFGRMHGQRKVMSASYVLYGNALRSLNKDLQHSDKAWDLSVMTSALSLEIYEVRTGTSAEVFLVTNLTMLVHQLQLDDWLATTRWGSC